MTHPIECSNNIVIIPISKVCFGFAAGGSEFKGKTFDEYDKKDKDEKIQYRLPFGGGSGATVSINPIAFLVVEEGKVKLLPVNHSSCIDKLLDYVPDLFEKIAQTKQKINSKPHINKTLRKTQENLEYNPKMKIKEESEEIAEELEDIFEEEYDDD